MKKLLLSVTIIGGLPGAAMAQSCMTTHNGFSSYTTCSDGSTALTTHSGNSDFTTTTPPYQPHPYGGYGIPDNRDDDEDE